MSAKECLESVRLLTVSVTGRLDPGADHLDSFKFMVDEAVPVLCLAGIADWISPSGNHQEFFDRSRLQAFGDSGGFIRHADIACIVLMVYDQRGHFDVADFLCGDGTGFF